MFWHIKSMATVYKRQLRKMCAIGFLFKVTREELDVVDCIALSIWETQRC